MTIVLDKVIEELVTQKVTALVQTVEDNVKLVRGIDSEIKDLSSDIETFNARLVEASKNPRANDHQVLRVVVKKFTSVVNEAQDTIANYVALKKKHGDDVLSKSLDKIPFCGKINAYANEIQSIRAKLDKINKVHENELLYLMMYEIKDRNKAETTLQIEKNKVLGFEEDFQIIKKRFLEASKNFIVIPIVGMAGTGKTAIASMIFEDPDIHCNSLRIWVPVTKLCDRKQKFISIIYQITKHTEDFSTMTEEMLEGKITTLLEDQTYFIVLDDVWEKKDWDSLKNAFPENLNGSRVLVTSRYGNVVDSKWKSHNLGKLSDEDGWVLNIEYIKFNDPLDKDLANELYSLYLLKYLAISGNLNVLPKSFRSLRELETLVIKTTTRTIQIEGGIWNMEKLRHIRTNTSAQLPFPLETNSKINSGGKDIHTLSTISPASCRKEIFSKTLNLQKLGVRGNISQLLEEKENICLINNLQMLKCLVNLKLYGQYDKVLTVPMLDKFARRLKKLSFSGTLFEWKDMAVLGSLEELEVLKLDDYAFKGESWELNNNVVFRRLQYLRIGRTNLVTWKLATENSFPALQSLILRNCYVIEKIPEEFANVHTLKVMELFHVCESATQSAEEIRKNIKNDGFKLIITSQKGTSFIISVEEQLSFSHCMNDEAAPSVKDVGVKHTSRGRRPVERIWYKVIKWNRNGSDLVDFIARENSL
nr:putative late blight resistance protein homolog R1B-8 [Ipomoea batatas]